MRLILPHASGQKWVDGDLFLAAWEVWHERYGPDQHASGQDVVMPRLASRDVLQAQLSKNRVFSLDVLCRMLLPASSRNTMQASEEMMRANEELLEPCDTVNSVTGRTVAGVKLSSFAVARLHELKTGSTFDELKVDVERVIEADVEEGEGPEQCLLSEGLAEWIDEPALPIGGLPPAGFSNPVEWLVEVIHEEAFIPRYRGAVLNARGAVKGWDNRLHTYFWPRPAIDRRRTERALAPLLSQAQALARSLGDWSAEDQAASIAFAHSVFRWGGVPQADVTADKVANVFRAGLEGVAPKGTPMNSGWTKVAAFATAHLDPSRQLVIWDSRVAHSLIRRLDVWLRAAGKSIADFDLLADIGKVPGRGGTRAKASYGLNWPNGYGRWPSVFAGSQLVRSIRDELNLRRIACPSLDGGSEEWSVRTVEMVLFMDGY